VTEKDSMIVALTLSLLGNMIPKDAIITELHANVLAENAYRAARALYNAGMKVPTEPTQ
jgi:hypothetical protein